MPLELKNLGSGDSPTTNQLIHLALRLFATGAATFFLYKYITKVIDVLDPTKKQKKASEVKVSLSDINLFSASVLSIILNKIWS